ncbi:MAG: hypothetical protein IKP28_05150 [Clostridia bacterium]|nr:hypothetical protein [Clostridia bacterium]
MIKMELFAPWILVIILYATCLAISLKRLRMYDKNNTADFEKNVPLFVLTILGMGIFHYYQGRSHWETLSAVLYPAIMLITIIVDRNLIDNNWKKNITKVFFPLLLTILLVNSGATALYAFLVNKNGEIYTLDKSYVENNKRLYEQRNLINSIEQKIGDIELLTNFESLLYSTLDKADTKKMNGFIDMFSYEDTTKIIDFLKLNKKALLIDKKTYLKIENKFHERFKENIYTDYTLYETYDFILIVPNELNEKAKQIEEISIYK